MPQVAARSIACYHPELSTLNLDEEAMSDLILHVTDDSFENEVLKPTARYWSITGPNGAARAR